jgi:membrane-associated phospholipid phosphatase
MAREGSYVNKCRIISLASLLVLLGSPQQAWGQPTSVPSGTPRSHPTTEPSPEALPSSERKDKAHVPLSKNFSVAEQWAILGIWAYDAAAFGFGKPIIKARLGDPEATTCGSCLFQSPPGFDRAISNAAYRGPSHGKLMGGFPDYLGYPIAPLAAAGVYAIDGAVWLGTGHGLFGSHNADHKFVAFFEMLGLALGINQTAKVLTGRLRPYYELKRQEEPGQQLPVPIDTNLSFFSGHTTISFGIAAFVYRDFSDWLVRKAFADSNSVPSILVGRVLPALGLYGVAGLVGASRIIDQAHYFSDVALGAVVGASVGNIVYAVHFDGHGDPRAKSESKLNASLVPFPGGLGVAGTF